MFDNISCFDEPRSISLLEVKFSWLCWVVTFLCCPCCVGVVNIWLYVFRCIAFVVLVIVV